MNNSDQSELHYKVVTCGDSNVGKTCVIIRATQDTFTDGVALNTVGSDRFSLPLDHLDQPVVLDIIDTAGQEVYRGLTTTFFRKADVALIFYSIDDPQSLENVDSWVQKVLDSTPSGDIQPIMYIIENKIDLREKDDGSLLTKVEGEKKAQELNIKFESVSAKTGENVNNLFLNVAAECLARPIPNEKIIIEEKTDGKKSDCNC